MKSTLSMLIHRLAYAACMFIGLLLIACQDTPSLYVTLAEWPLNAKNLHIRAIQDTQSVEFSDALLGQTHFIIPLSDFSDSPITIEVTALDADGCALGQSKVDVSVPSGIRRYSEQGVRIAMWPHPSCAIGVSILAGKGNIAARQVDFSCKGEHGTRCEKLVEKGSVMTLDAQGQTGVYTSWGTMCPKGAVCQFEVQRPAELAVSFLARACSADGWCRQAPEQPIERLWSIWGSAASDVWTVGDNGLIAHWDGMVWRMVAVDTDRHLRALWGSSASDIWAVGDGGTIIHWNGIQWNRVDVNVDSTADLYSIWGSGAQDVWVGGKEGRLLHWNGHSWTPFHLASNFTVFNMWGINSEKIWAVGQGGAISTWDGQAWTDQPAKITTADIRGIWGTSENDIWVVPNNSRPLHFDGRIWTSFYTSLSGNLGIWGNSPKNVWMVGFYGNVQHWDGTEWTFVDPSQPAYTPGWARFSVWGSSSDDVWTVGEFGTMTHWDGAGWTEHGILQDSVGIYSLLDIKGSSAIGLWAVGSGTNGGAIFHAEGNELKPVYQNTRHGLAKLWINSSTDIVALGQLDLILHYDGVRWNELPWPSIDHSGIYYGIWGDGTGDVWLVGQRGMIAHWDHSVRHWTTSSTGTQRHLFGIYGFGPNDIWAAGQELTHWDGRSWQTSAVVGDMYNIWGTTSNDLWAVGQGNKIYHWDGNSWKTSASPLQDHDIGAYVGLNAVWGSNASDVWVAGYRGNMAHWNGSSWREVASGTKNSLYGLWGTDSSKVWTVGVLDTVLLRVPPIIIP